jgi:hypothetical protein
MSHPLAAAIREHLARYLAGETTLDALGDWFVPATWDIDQTGDQTAVDLTDEIILRLAEYSNGDCSEAQLRELLRPLVGPPPVGSVVPA